MARVCKIRKMAHHLRKVNGIYQVQRKIPKGLEEVAARLEGKTTLSKKQREAGQTVPTLEWFIRSTGTGNPREAENIRDEQLDPEYRALVKRCEAASDPDTLAETLITETQTVRHLPSRRRVSRMTDSFVHQTSANLAVEYGGAVPSHLADTVRQIIAARFVGERAGIDDVDSVVREITEALYASPSSAGQVRRDVLAAIVAPRPDQEVVEFDAVLLSWKNANKLDDTDKKLKHMQNRWRDFFAWLVQKRGYPCDSRDIARITTDDLDEYKEHFKALMNAPDPKMRISSKTMEDYLRQITGLYNYAIDEKRSWKQALAAIVAGFHVPKGHTDPTAKYVDFDPYEISRILIKARFAPPEIRWPNWIAAYSGARLAEVCEAQTNDVETDEKGIVIFHIRRENRPGKQATLKTGEISERPVPLHKTVLDEDDGAFLAYVQWVRDTYYGGGHGPLFPQFELWRGRLNNDASNRLVAWLRDKETGPGIDHPKKVFHSWRHTVKTRFRGVDENDIPYISREDVADKLTGHASGKIGRTYGIFPNPVLAAAVRRVPAWPI